MVSLAEWQVGAEQIVPLDTHGFVPVMETIVSPAMGTYEQAAEYEQRQITLDELAAIELQKQKLAQFEANQQALVDYNKALAEQQETTFLEDLAQEYVDFIEGDSTTAEFITGGLQQLVGGSGIYVRFQGASATQGDIWEIEVYGSHRKQTNKSNATIEMVR